MDCHAWDAAGEEHLDYHWEPIGGAPRNYLENPRLIPEDVPNPVVVAPSSPQYDTLESFLSEERAQRYRYRLTATSRATGLSSWSEVEVFVLSSRPSVYCPLELEVDEGDTVVLACEGADPLSFRLDDGDDAGASPVLWEWEGLWGASTAPLTAADTPAPLFTAPEGSAGRTYHYVASMTTNSSGVARTARRRVSVTVVGREAAGDPAPEITCMDFEGLWRVKRFKIYCAVKNEPTGATYSWKSLGPAKDMALLTAGTDSLRPTFKVDYSASDQPGADGKTYIEPEYKYRVAMSVPGIADVTQDVTVKLRYDLTLMTCTKEYEVYPGDPNFELNCMANDDLKNPFWELSHGPLSADKSEKILKERLEDFAWRRVYKRHFNPTFFVPKSFRKDAVGDIDYYQYYICVFERDYAPYPDVEYGLVGQSEYITVKVLRKPAVKADCEDPEPVYEGSEDITLDCSLPTGAPDGSSYNYAWAARGDTPGTGLLSKADIRNPVFYVPDEVDADETYEYTLTVTAENAVDGTADVTVTVLDRPDIAVTCTDPDPVYEGAEAFPLDCTAEGDPDGSLYAYAWTARNSTSAAADLDRLVAGTDGPTPTFEAPPLASATTEYEYTLTVTAAEVEADPVDVTVTVMDKPQIAVTCEGHPYLVYEGSVEHILLDCSAKDAPDASTYTYAWAARNNASATKAMDRLAGTDGPKPTFAVPPAVEQTTKYEYTLTVSADNAVDGTADVTVTVLHKPDIVVACTNPDPVYEGSVDITLACTASGAPDGSAYAYAWTVRNSTSVATDTDLLSATDMLSPTFDVPSSASQTTRYEYTLTVTADNAEAGTEEVTVTVLNAGAITLACANPDPVYEGSDNISLSCEASGASGEDPVYSYVWEALDNTSATEDMGLLSAADIASPTFYVPNNVDADETYEYRVTVTADNAEAGTADVTVMVLNAGAIALACADPDPVYEGADNISLSCEASGASGEDPVYSYVWEALDNTSATEDMGLLSAADIASPVFDVPNNVDADETYTYSVRATAENAEAGAAEVRVMVLNKNVLALVCMDPDPVYEGSEDITLDCSASGAPGVPDGSDGSAYEYAWAAHGSTANMDMLTAGTDGPTPTFAVPKDVPESTKYEYVLTVSAAHADPATVEVTVTVLNTGALALSCANPDPVYEGSPDLVLNCSASGGPGGPDASAYEYAWAAHGATPDTDLLSAVDVASPTFAVPTEVAADETYEYLVTVSAENAEDAMAEVTVTVLNKPALALACANPDPVYEGSEDIAFSCEASGAPDGPDGSAYEYIWAARGSTTDTDRLVAGMDGPTPTFAVPTEVAADETYEYLVTVSAENAEDAMAEVTVTVLNKPALALACANPDPVYEGSEDIAFSCEASGAPDGPDGSAYEYIWAARGSTTDTDRLVAGMDGPTPTFAVPDAVDADETYEYLVTVSAEHAEDAMAEVIVTVLDKPALALACATPDPVYEGSPDFTLDCAASGAPDGSAYEYAWAAHGATLDTDLLSAVDVASPTFAVPDAVDADETYEYLLTASAENAEDAMAEVTVTVLDKIETPAPGPDPVAPDPDPDPDPVAPDPDPDPDPTPPVAGGPDPVSPSPDPGAFVIDPSGLGVRTSVSSLRFGVQSSDTQVSLDALTDRISTSVSGPYHAGRMTLASDGDLAFDERGEVALSIEMATPVVLRRRGDEKAPLLVLSPSWSMAESCEQLSSRSIGGLHTETQLSESDCRMLLFGGELDLSGAPTGRYAGNLNVILRTALGEETHSVPVEVTVAPAQRVITIGPGGVRFDTSREVPAGLTAEQNVSIYPDVAYLTREAPSGAFELSNPSLIPLEVSVSARFGYAEATAAGFETVVEDPDHARLGDLSEALEIHPGTLILMPGEQRVVRYGVREEALATMTEAGYAAFFEVVSSPRRYVRTDQLPEASSIGKTARVTMRVPGAYAPEAGVASLRAELLSVSQGAALSATFLVETDGAPFLGEVAAYDGDGRELGRRRTLVYTRSRVRMSLDRLPEGEAVFLRFAPSGSGRVSEPASVPWNAPRRDARGGREIGAAHILKN